MVYRPPSRAQQRAADKGRSRCAALDYEIFGNHWQPRRKKMLCKGGGKEDFGYKRPRAQGPNVNPI
ncbi:hypothetical protein TSAR_010047 [Trichomalopsis sarcophagae]|uniref:Uncharacterized protein n=1 Tax=Trichomalopsis sarcophagae TaxID=543379 RepID=A0A232ED23_9HYME|nr:hypothetical protein TSAR_010047 [Trichomalopsis sarcophagae]